MNIVANWSYPTAIKMGRGRIKELADYIRSNLLKFRIESDDPVPQYLDEIDAAVKSE